MKFAALHLATPGKSTLRTLFCADVAIASMEMHAPAHVRALNANAARTVGATSSVTVDIVNDSQWATYVTLAIEADVVRP